MSQILSWELRPWGLLGFCSEAYRSSLPLTDAKDAASRMIRLDPRAAYCAVD